MSKPPTYTELLAKVSELEQNPAHRVLHQRLAAAKQHLSKVQQHLSVILGEQRYDEPLAVHDVRMSLQELEDVIAGHVLVPPAVDKEQRARRSA